MIILKKTPSFHPRYRIYSIRFSVGIKEKKHFQVHTCETFVMASVNIVGNWMGGRDEVVVHSRNQFAAPKTHMGIGYSL